MFERGLDVQSVKFWRAVAAGAATASAQKERICSEELGISISIKVSLLDERCRWFIGHEVINTVRSIHETNCGWWKLWAWGEYSMLAYAMGEGEYSGEGLQGKEVPWPVTIWSRGYHSGWCMQVTDMTCSYMQAMTEAISRLSSMSPPRKARRGCGNKMAKTAAHYTFSFWEGWMAERCDNQDIQDTTLMIQKQPWRVFGCVGGQVERAFKSTGLELGDYEQVVVDPDSKMEQEAGHEMERRSIALRMLR